MSKVIGIGGVFLNFLGDETELIKWYGKVFSMKVSKYGASFIEGEQLALLSFKKADHHTPSLNLRVENIEEAVNDVLINGGLIHQKIKDYSYGKFAQIIDPYGNSVELWEPVVEYYKQMVNNEVDS